MKAQSLGFILGCTVALSGVPAQDAMTPEVQALKDQFDAKMKLEVQQPHDAGVVDLIVKYTAALDRALVAAQQAGKLEDAVAIKADKEAMATGVGLPAADDKATPLVAKQLRGTYRSGISRLEAERARRLQPLQADFVRSLDALVTRLTKEGKFDEALAVKGQREKLAASLALPAQPGAGQLMASNVPSSRATKDAPFVNSLGMKFVSVPNTTVLMCIHETRRSDYAAYSGSSSPVNDSWKNVSRNGVPVGDKNDHPVVNVNWEDVQGFCAWLARKEGLKYRLPTDREWSCAVGLGTKEKKDASLESLNRKLSDEYPWGSKWPPPNDAGNYSDTTIKAAMPNQVSIDGFTDGFPTTSPVMSFKPNRLGFYDLGGNVWEWCEDWMLDAGGKDRVRRGASWSSLSKEDILSSYRAHNRPDVRAADFGFRCVLELP